MKASHARRELKDQWFANEQSLSAGSQLGALRLALSGPVMGQCRLVCRGCTQLLVRLVPYLIF